MSHAAVNESQVTVRRAGHRMELSMHSHPAVLRPVRLALEEFGRESGLSCEDTDKIGLAINEAMANVIRHGYGNATDRPIEVTFERRGDKSIAEVVVKIRDWARPFDPATLPTAPPPCDLDQIKPGGLGVHYIRRVMDEVSYTPLADGMLLTMVKRATKV